MENQLLYDITDVCKSLGTTSRTLRFYEEKGIITSTTNPPSLRRHYTQEQIARIKNVFTLRALGLSVKTIAELQSKDLDLTEAVLMKRAEIQTSIEWHLREINLLNEALATLESEQTQLTAENCCCPKANEEEYAIAFLCTKAIVEGENVTLYHHLSARLATYMPQEVYSVVRNDTLAQLGDFVSSEDILADENFPNRLYSFVRYEKLGLKITFVFHHSKIDGLWLGYYEPKHKNRNKRCAL